MLMVVAILVAIAAALSPSIAVAAFPGSNGRIAYAGFPAGESVTNLFSILPDGSGLQRLTDDTAPNREPSWSSDGLELVFTRWPAGPESRHLVRMNADGTDPTPVVTRGSCCVAPSFSPNGRRILYSTGIALRTIRVDGTRQRRVLSARERDSFFTQATYSPSGRRIAFAGRPDGKKRAGIWSIRRNGTRLRRLTARFNDGDPDYSPDGESIVFDSPGGIRVMRADGSHERLIPGTDGGGSPAFAPAGDRIVLSIVGFAVVGVSCSDIYTISLAGSDRRRITDNCQVDGSIGTAVTPSWQPLPASP
jgi:Tol biopolymer transport system component